MRNILLIIIFLIFLSFVNGEEAKLGESQSTEISGQNLVIEKIASDKIAIKVGDEVKIIKLSETDVIKGLKITILEIFYVTEKESRWVRLSIEASYVCGDNKCEVYEKDSCCKDCGCSTGYECRDNECELPSKLNDCNKDDDCNDNNESTLDLCKGSPKKCIYISSLECNKDEDCNDDNECTKDTCVENSCFNTKIENCVGNVTKINEENKTIEKNEEKIVVPKEQKKSFLMRIIEFIKQKLFK